MFMLVLVLSSYGIEVFVMSFVVIIVQIMGVLVIVHWSVNSRSNTRVKYGVPSIKI